MHEFRRWWRSCSSASVEPVTEACLTPRVSRDSPHIFELYLPGLLLFKTVDIKPSPLMPSSRAVKTYEREPHR